MPIPSVSVCAHEMTAIALNEHRLPQAYPKSTKELDVALHVDTAQEDEKGQQEEKKIGKEKAKGINHQESNAEQEPEASVAQS